jgi:hypothetical protein
VKGRRGEFAEQVQVRERRGGRAGKEDRGVKGRGWQEGGVEIWWAGLCRIARRTMHGPSPSTALQLTTRGITSIITCKERAKRTRCPLVLLRRGAQAPGADGEEAAVAVAEPYAVYRLNGEGRRERGCWRERKAISGGRNGGQGSAALPASLLSFYPTHTHTSSPSHTHTHTHR